METVNHIKCYSDKIRLMINCIFDDSHFVDDKYLLKLCLVYNYINKYENDPHSMDLHKRITELSLGYRTTRWLCDEIICNMKSLEICTFDYTPGEKHDIFNIGVLREIDYLLG